MCTPGRPVRLRLRVHRAMMAQTGPVAEFSDVVRRRRMVRAYRDDPVHPGVVDRLLEHAVHAPSAGFSQGWAFLLLDGDEDRDRFWHAASPPHRSQRRPT
ncbi:MAG: nitroreductase family protein [Nocardioidaceae bacterium]